MVQRKLKTPWALISFLREHTNAECFISMITEAAQLCPGTIRRQRAGSEANGPGELLADFAYSPIVWNSQMCTHPHSQSVLPQKHILKDRFRECPLAILSLFRWVAFSYGLCSTQKEKSTMKKLSDLSPTTGSFRLTSTGLLRVLSFNSGYSAPSGSLWGGRETTMCSRIADLQQQASNSAQKLGNKKVEVWAVFNLIVSETAYALRYSFFLCGSVKMHCYFEETK